MPLLTSFASELAGTSDRCLAVTAGFAAFLRTLDVGEAGRVEVADEGVDCLTVMLRLLDAAAMSGVQLRFHRTREDNLVFEVTAVRRMPNRRRWVWWAAAWLELVQRR